MRAPLFSLAAGSLAVLGACADATPTAPLTRPELAPLTSATSVTEPVSGPWARIIEGTTGQGSLYAIYIPRTPNQSRDAVFYAHGFRDAPGSIDLRDQDGLVDIRERLGEMGFAFAYSSFSENGFAVKDGAQRTHQLRGLVASAMGGQPGRSFLMGHSLGGAIGLYLAETYPNQYDGALLMCGMVGGSLLQTQYLGNVRALFDFYYPGRLPGSVLISPGRPITLQEVIGIVGPNPAGMMAIASTREAPLPFVPAAATSTLIGSLFGALSFHQRGIENILDLMNGHTPFDNTAGYSLGTPLFGGAPAMIADANNRITRYSFDRSAQNYLERHFTPTGDLRIPVLTVHNSWDPGVPAFHEAALLEAVERAGATANLYQRLIAPGAGHCSIPATVAVQRFQDLVGWVSSGQKPTT
jgi:pimeloyl-ACP methyl ester carboxylesterase